ncbi:MAG: hypothetical protein K0R57_1856 [Paenibacillaceae bacterium]|nr:hypothetical protein [Paenibacillaceae bacterium]
MFKSYRTTRLVMVGLIMCLFLSYVPLATDKAYAMESVLRTVSVEETVGIERIQSLVRIPLTLDDSEGVTDVSYLRVYLGGTSLVFQATDVVLYPSGHVKGANLYVADNYAARQSKTYTIILSTEAAAFVNSITVTNNTNDITFAGNDLSVTFNKDATANPGTIKAITSSKGTVTIGSPGNPSTNKFAGPRASIRLEALFTNMNDDFETGAFTINGSPVGWSPIAVSGSPVFQWSNSMYKNGSKSVQITNSNSSIQGRWESDKVPVKQGYQYYVEGWIKASAISLPASGTNTGAAMGYKFYDAANNLISEVYSNSTSSSSWAQVYTAVTNVPLNATKVSLFCSLNAGGTAWFDSLSFVEGESLATNMDNTSNTQQNDSLTYENGPLFAKVTIVNQQKRAGTPVDAYQTIEYLIPKYNSYFDQVVEYGGASSNPDSGVSGGTPLYLLQGPIYLGGNDTPTRNDQIVSYSLGTTGSSLAGDTKLAVVDSSTQTAFIPVALHDDGFTNIDYYGDQLRIIGPNDVPVGLTKFYFHFYTHNKTYTSYIINNDTSAGSLNRKAIEYANPLVGIVDKMGGSFDTDIVPLIKQINDLAGNANLRPDAWTMSALANYVNYKITGNPAYKSTADSIVNANVASGMTSVSYWENQILNGTYNVWTLHGIYTIGMFYNQSPLLWQIADAAGQAAINKRGFVDNYGYNHIANLPDDVASKTGVSNMEFTSGVVYMWGHKQAGNTVAYNYIKNMLSNPIFHNFVNSNEVPYNSVVNGQYVPIVTSGPNNVLQPHYEALTTSVYDEVTMVSGGELHYEVPNYRMMFHAVDIDTGHKGQDNSGWPNDDRLQNHFWRLGFANGYAYNIKLFLGNSEERNPTVGITTIKMILNQLISTLNTPVPDQSGANGVKQFPLIIDPGYQYPFNTYGYYGARVYDPTTLVNIAHSLNNLYTQLKLYVPVPNAGFELNPINANTWSAFNWGGSPTVTWAGDAVHSGDHSLKVTNAITAIGGVNKDLISNRIAVSPNKSYTLKGWIKTDAVISPKPSEGAYYAIGFSDSTGAWIGGSIYTNVLTGTNGWAQVSVTVTSPSNAAKATISARLNGSGTAWFDDLQLIQE